VDGDLTLRYKSRRFVNVTLKWFLLCGCALAAQAAETSKVLQVLDGDTCVLEDNRRVRYLGINAPEKGDVHAEEAAQANNRLVGGKKVKLEFGKQREDRDGRLLAYVFVGQILVNEELLRQGQAHLFRPIANRYKDRLFKAQEEAIAAGRGIWAKSADRKLAISSVHARPDKGGKENLNDEYIVIESRSDKAVELTGWTVSDESNHRYLVPNFVLQPNAKVTLRTGLGANTTSELFWGSRVAIWNDDHDTVFIKDSEGNLVLVHVY